jgi:dipeptidyl aminopeptidase/acylaminoacyl peptidase
VPTGSELPVLVWGNGGCIADGAAFLALLNQVASHGIYVIASGAPGGRGETTAAMMTQAFDWVSSAAVLAKFPYIDSTRIAVAG